MDSRLRGNDERSGIPAFTGMAARTLTTETQKHPAFPVAAGAFIR